MGQVRCRMFYIASSLHYCTVRRNVSENSVSLSIFLDNDSIENAYKAVFMALRL